MDTTQRMQLTTDSFQLDDLIRKVQDATVSIAELQQVSSLVSKINSDSLSASTRYLPVIEKFIATMDSRHVSMTGTGQHESEGRQKENVTAGNDSQQGELPATQQANRELNDLQPIMNSLRSGFRSIGDQIDTSFIKKMREGNTVFERFVGGVLDGLEKIAQKMIENAIITGILNLITGGQASMLMAGLNAGGIGMASGGIITEPIYGIGTRTGRSYMMGEAGPERVQPLTSFGGRGEPVIVEISGNFELGHRALIASFKEARIIDRKLGGNW